MSPSPTVWCCGWLVACAALANLAPAADASAACRIRFVTAQSGSFSTTGEDSCEGWLISPASSTTQQVLTVNSITLIKGATVLAGEADYLDVIVPGPTGGILEKRYTSSNIDQLPNRWRLNHHEILVIINAVSKGTVIEFRYEADLDEVVISREVATFPAIAAVVAAASVIVAFLFTSALCICRRRRVSPRRTPLVPDTSLTIEEEDRTQTALGDLPTRCWHATPGAAEEECCLCLENFQEGETVRILGCHHYFHKDCIDHWFAAKRRMQRTCPLCKRNPLVTIQGGGEEEIVMDNEPVARAPPQSHAPEHPAFQLHGRRSAPRATNAAVGGSTQQPGALRKNSDTTVADVEFGFEEVMDNEPVVRVPPKSHIPQRQALQHHGRSAAGATTTAVEGSTQQPGTLQQSVDNSAANAVLGFEDGRASRQSSPNAAPAATALGRSVDEIV